MFFKIKLTHHCFKSSPSICTSWIERVDFFLFFGLVRFTLDQLVSSPPFPLLSAASPLADIITPSYRVTLPFHWAKKCSRSLLHLPVTLCPITSPIEPKLKHWIRTTTIGYLLRTAWLPPSTAIKRLCQSWSLSALLNRISILPPW
jgi:hypothetical protein